MIAANSPFPQFFDSDGLPLENGKIYIGTAGLDPRTNPVSVYWDYAGVSPASQPLRTSGGYIVRSGAPAAFFVNSGHSMAVYTAADVLVWSASDSSQWNVEQRAQDAIAVVAGDLAALDATAIAYDPETAADAGTIAAKLRESVSVLDFGAVADWNGSAGTDNSTAFTDAIEYANTNRVKLTVPAGRYSVGTSGVTVSASFQNFEMEFDSGAELVCTYSGGAHPFLLQLSGIGANCKIRGNGAKLTYANAPATRQTNHAVYLFGAENTITDLEVSGFTITNAPNMALAVFAGPMGGASTGNRGVKITDIRAVNPKADGVHVENFDSGVKIERIEIDTPGDDAVVVANYSGSSGAPTKSGATADVVIGDIYVSSAYSSIVRLLGVNRCNISKLRGTLGNTFGGIGAVAISCDETSGDYSAPNVDITATDIVTYGGGGLIYWSDGGELSGLRVENAICKGINKYGVRLLQGSESTGSKINDITMVDVHLQNATNSGVGTDWPIWCDRIARSTFDRIRVSNAPSVALFDECDRVTIGTMETHSSGSTGSAWKFTGNTYLTIGRLAIDAGCSFTTGVEATGNTHVWHTALWDISDATTPLTRSGNSVVYGWCQAESAAQYIGAKSAGTTETVSYGHSMWTGTTYNLQVSFSESEGAATGVKNRTATGFDVDFVAASNGLTAHYTAATNIGY